MGHEGGRLLRHALCACVLMLPLLSPAVTTVIYPRPEADSDRRSQYPARLLELALERANSQFRVQRSDVRMQQGRALLMLRQGKGIDIVCFMTSAERETSMLPIRIPIDKGLIGWRLLLVNKERAGTPGWTDLDQLKQLRAGQGSDWPDFDILRANGFKVHGTSNYEGLFTMLAQGRIDYFPRSVNEIWSEADMHSQELAVEPSIVLRYPSASYYFVRKGNEKLAADVTAGLEKMIADGSFDKLFLEYYGDLLKRSGLKERRIIDLRNPLLPDGIPALRQHLMYRE